ncbi:MAG: DUF1064 domain-containing protein [Pseudomonadota bacterium]|nr:DUF1064 domain-containing protein [Pseudomonadota bacterium]
MTFTRMTADEYKARNGFSPERPKPSKYNAQPTEVDGIRFASRAESIRYQQLKMMQQMGRIQNLKLQVPFICEVNRRVVCKYIADFVYVEDGMKITEDVKGMLTPLYKLKKRLMEACHNVVIREVKVR